MATPLVTLRYLPDLSQRRYGVLELGAANVEAIREEHCLLREACAALLGVPPEALTREQVRALAARRLAE